MNFNRIELENVSKIYFIENPKTGLILSRRALTGVNLSFFAGEIHGLLGENGAGKSTIVHLLSGITSPTTGNIRIDDNCVCISTPNEAIKNGISIIMQSLPAVMEATIFEQLMLENNFGKVFQIVNKKKIEKEIVGIIKNWSGNYFNFDRKIKELSREELFFLELASKIYKQPKILILDESISFIPSNKRPSFFHKLKKYAKSKNVAVIVITHDILEAIEVSDKITIMKQGMNIKTVNVENMKMKISYYKISKLIKGIMFNTNISCKDVFKNETKSISKIDIKKKLQLKGLCIEVYSKKASLKNIKIEALDGEITGAFFSNSSYFKIFEDLISGMLSNCKGIDGGISIGEHNVFIPFCNISPSRLLKEKIGFIPSDRYYRASNPLISIKDALSVYHIKKNIIKRSIEDEFASSILREEGITSSIHDTCNTLSGGQLQRIILNRCLREAPQIIILVEPFRGLDLYSMNILGNKLLDLSKIKKTILIFTQEENNEIYSKIFDRTFYL